MFHKTLLGTLACAAVAAAAIVIVKAIEDRKEDLPEKDDDNEVHFIEITDSEGIEGPSEEKEEEAEKEPEDASPEPEEEKTDSEKPEETQENPEEKEQDTDKEVEIQQFHAFPEDPDELQEDVREILELYPFLKADFIEKVLDKNAEFMESYPEDTLVCVTHKVEFTEMRTLLEFEMIMTDATYICTQIDRETLEVSRRFFSEDGAVVSDILNVANQVNALHGNYIGYNLE